MFYGAIGIIWLIVSLAFMLGFAYILFVLSAKETGNLKMAGQVLAWIIVAGAVLALIFGLWGGMFGKGMMGSGYYKGTMKAPTTKRMTPEQMKEFMKKYQK